MSHEVEHLAFSAGEALQSLVGARIRVVGVFFFFSIVLSFVIQPDSRRKGLTSLGSSSGSGLWGSGSQFTPSVVSQAPCAPVITSDPAKDVKSGSVGVPKFGVPRSVRERPSLVRQTDRSNLLRRKVLRRRDQSAARSDPDSVRWAFRGKCSSALGGRRRRSGCTPVRRHDPGRHGPTGGQLHAELSEPDPARPGHHSGH